MAQFALDPRKIAGVQEYTLNMLASRKEFETPEVIFGLAELAARLIAKNTSGTWIDKKDILEAVIDHMTTTTRIGCGQSDEPSRIITLN